MVSKLVPLDRPINCEDLVDKLNELIDYIGKRECMYHTIHDVCIWCKTDDEDE